MNPIHAHQRPNIISTNEMTPCLRCPAVTAWCHCCAIVLIVTTKTRSKNSSSVVEVRPSSFGSRSRIGRIRTTGVDAIAALKNTGAPPVASVLRTDGARGVPRDAERRQLKEAETPKPDPAAIWEDPPPDRACRIRRA